MYLDGGFVSFGGFEGVREEGRRTGPCLWRDIVSLVSFVALCCALLFMERRFGGKVDVLKPCILVVFIEWFF